MAKKYIANGHIYEEDSTSRKTMVQGFIREESTAEPAVVSGAVHSLAAYGGLAAHGGIAGRSGGMAG